MSMREVDNVLQHHFLKVTNDEIERLSLPALEPLAKRRRMDHVDESHDSQVCYPLVSVALYSFYITLLSFDDCLLLYLLYFLGANILYFLFFSGLRLS